MSNKHAAMSTIDGDAAVLATHRESADAGGTWFDVYKSSAHRGPRSANEVIFPPATTKWSSVQMSTSASACLSACVSNSSARDGSATPDGWLCAKIIAAALRASAAFTISRG